MKQNLQYLVLLALGGALVVTPGCGGSPDGGGGGGGGGGGTSGGDGPVGPSGTAYSESDRQRWDAAYALFTGSAAEGYTPAECAQIVSAFESASSQHEGGRWAEAVYMIAVTHERCGDAEQARQFYERTLSITPTFCGARVAEGVRQYRAGDVTAARATFERAVREDARCTEGYVNLAILQRRTSGGAAEALNNLRRALAITSSYLPAFNQMALLYYQQAAERGSGQATVAGGTAQAAGAARAAETAASTDASDRERRQAEARRRAEGQMLDLAAVVCRQATLIDGNYAPIYNTWGLINVRQGDIRGALANFARAWGLDNDFFEAHMNFAELTLSFRGYEDAERGFRRATELQGSNYDAWIGLGAALRGLGRLDDAQAAYERAVQLDAQRPEAYFNLGLLYQDYMGGTEAQWRQAQQYYRQFAERARSRPEFAEMMPSVERTCGCDTGEEAQRRRRARGRAGYGRRRSCDPGRIEQIDCAIALQRELQEMQRQAEEMTRRIEAQAASQGGGEATPPPAESPPPAQ